MLVGEHGGDQMVPRIAMMQALPGFSAGHELKAATIPRRKRTPTRMLGLVRWRK